MHRRLGISLAGLLLIMAVVSTATGAESRESMPPVYRFGVVPQFEQRKLYATWKPIVDELERRTGLRFSLVTTLKIQDFEKAFFQEEFDFVYVNPYHVVQRSATPAYLPLLADQTPLRGIVVVRRDGPIQTLDALNGQKMAFPSANALGSSLMVRSDLEQIHHLRVEPLYVKTHSSVYLHVAKGLVAAGGGVEKTLREQDQTLQEQLRVIYTTRPCPSHPIAAHDRVPQEIRERVRAALIALAESPEGRQMLARVPVTRFVPASYQDYKALLGWGLEKYWRPIDPKD